MVKRVRVASFNVENLFSRVEVFTGQDEATGGEVLRAIAGLQDMLEQALYDRSEIISHFNNHELFRYIDVRCDRVAKEGASPRFFTKIEEGTGRVLRMNPDINGPSDWSGAIEFKRQRLSAVSQRNLARVILEELRADILCLCEVEDRRLLQQFADDGLQGSFPYNVLLEGNDTRGIDVALLSRHPIGEIRTNIFQRDGSGGLFNRDCLEVEVLVEGAGPLFVLCNHFKSKGGSPQAEKDTDLKRIAQAGAVRTLLAQRYRDEGGWKRRVIVAGDLNESNERNGANGANLGGRQTSIDDLLQGIGLVDVLRAKLPLEQRWTYEFSGRRQQIDYLLADDQSASKVVACGAVYSGRFTDGSNGIASPIDAASDHAAIWIELDLPDTSS